MKRFLNFRSWPISFWLFLILFVGVGAVVHWALTSPQVVLLLPARGAKWIARDEPFNLDTPVPMSFSAFSTTFVLSTPRSTAVLRVTALRRVVVIVDGKSIFDNGADIPDWHREYFVKLPQISLTAGTHQLKLLVANRFGPPLVRADCAELGIATDPSWQTSADQHQWTSAVSADRKWVPAMTGDFPTAAGSMKRLWPMVVGLVVFGSGLYLILTHRLRGQQIAWGRWVKWIVLVAWVLLAWNNLFQVPAYVGYDAPSHLEYIRYVAEHWRVPLPNELWESFHPPLYYFCSAVLYKLTRAAGASADNAAVLLRLLPLLCGMFMVELSYRAARIAFPGREASHAAAAVIGGLVPMNIYMAQAVSNEPMAACLGGLITLLCLKLLVQSHEGKTGSRLRWILHIAMLGLIAGLAVLTKLSGLVWLGPCSIALIIAANARRCVGDSTLKRCANATGAIAIFVAVTAVVSGWYFARNYHALGVPFLSHSTIANARWWQQPGFRSPMHFFRFGTALSHPVFGDLTSFWDDLYSTLWSDGMFNGGLLFQARPPWNYGLMACGLWLSLLPMAALIAGVFRAFSRNKHHAISANELIAVRFSVGSLVIFMAALFYVCLTWPIYSDVKSSYLLALTPSVAVLATAGTRRLASGPVVRCLGCGMLMCWAVVSYLAYFVW